jgi:hypothetical protein
MGTSHRDLATDISGGGSWVIENSDLADNGLTAGPNIYLADGEMLLTLPATSVAQPYEVPNSVGGLYPGSKIYLTRACVARNSRRARSNPEW